MTSIRNLIVLSVLCITSACSQYSLGKIQSGSQLSSITVGLTKDTDLLDIIGEPDVYREDGEISFMLYYSKVKEEENFYNNFYKSEEYMHIFVFKQGVLSLKQTRQIGTSRSFKLDPSFYNVLDKFYN